MTRLIHGLSDLADRYDVVLSDIWGVIHNGREHFPEPCAALARWRTERGPVVLVSNAPRPASDVVPQLRERLAEAAARKLPMVCANPDIVVQRGDRLVYCGGALAALYESLGGPVRMAGKPHAPIYAAAIAEAERLLGRKVDRARVLCIGDGVVTDVRGANDQGLDVLFIASGIHGDAALGPDGALSEAGVAALLAPEQVTAAYAMGDLAW
jgi:ribonucleotide monophosphatase NagD (HAD superfamily)